jgi:prolyl 4-hydroxylase
VSTQRITPELRSWIVAQAEEGFGPEAVLKAMLASGWQEAVALEAMEGTLREHLAAKGLSPDEVLARIATVPEATPAPVAAQPVAVPEPDLTQSPLVIDCGDRQVTVLGALQLPRVVILSGLLSDEECDALIAAATPRMARSLTVSTQTGGEEVHDGRTSNGMFFQRGESELVSRIEARIARLVRWPVENGEGIQVLQYRPGAQYLPHYDYFDPSEPGTPSILQRGGQRVGTVVMYLSEPEKGGGTSFPDVGFEVAPKRGNAVFFSYAQAHPSSKSLHGGSPVIVGEKWIATKWLRERVFA